MRQIGERFVADDGTLVEVVKSEIRCSECYFVGRDCSSKDLECRDYRRPDKKNVIFKKSRTMNSEDSLLNNITMKKYYAVAPKEGRISKFLTNGKRYEIIDFDIQGGKVAAYGTFGRGFTIEDDNGHRRYCIEYKCAYIDGLYWTIVEEEEQ